MTRSEGKAEDHQDGPLREVYPERREPVLRQSGRRTVSFPGVRRETSPGEFEPWFVTPETDLSGVPLELLEQMDTQMYYCGETDERDAKFSETRKHIQRVMSQRSPS